jgi:hypothetical protein
MEKSETESKRQTELSEEFGGFGGAVCLAVQTDGVKQTVGLEEMRRVLGQQPFDLWHRVLLCQFHGGVPLRTGRDDRSTGRNRSPRAENKANQAKQQDLVKSDAAVDCGLDFVALDEAGDSFLRQADLKPARIRGGDGKEAGGEKARAWHIPT